MENSQLPIKDLKFYGIMEEDGTFTRKLSEKEQQRFLSGAMLIADSEDGTVTFKLSADHSRLNVQAFKREINLRKLLEESKKHIVYNSLILVAQDAHAQEREKEPLEYERNAIVYDPEKDEAKEYNLLKHTKELTEVVLKTNNNDEKDKYQQELVKLRDYLLRKMDQYPEIAKDIAQDMNVVSGQLNIVQTSFSPGYNPKTKVTRPRLDVNDRDTYEDANSNREIRAENHQEHIERRNAGRKR